MDPKPGEQLYYHLGTTRRAAVSPAPVGAMWDATWLKTKGPDGRCLVVRTPGGDWQIDGGVWQRTGAAPLLTVTPSYAAGDYEAFLTDGHLVPVDVE